MDEMELTIATAGIGLIGISAGFLASEVWSFRHIVLSTFPKFSEPDHLPRISQHTFDHWPILYLMICSNFGWGLFQIGWIRQATNWRFQSQTVKLNADIIGRGVRFNIFVPPAASVLALLLGYFHVKNSGAQELAWVQLCNLTSLFFNLVVSWKSLNAVELVAVFMSLDVTSAALSMILSDKQVMSARKLVFFITVAQSAALLAFGIIAYHATDIVRHPESELEFAIWWLGPFDHTLRVPWGFWIFYAIRIITIFNTIWRSWAFTPIFNESEHLAKHRALNFREPPQRAHQGDAYLNMELTDHNDTSVLANPVTRIAAQEHQLFLPYTFLFSYRDSPATWDNMWLVHLPTIITTFLSFQALLSQCKSLDGAWIEWGQMTALVICIIGLAHWGMYTTIYLLLLKKNLHLNVAGPWGAKYGSPKIADYAQWLESREKRD